MGCSKMKKKVLGFIFIFCVLFSVGSIIYDKIADKELTFEQKVLDIMNYDELTGTKNVDTIIFLTEVDGGYFCVGTASSDETIHFEYIREENGKLEFGGKSFSNLAKIISNEGHGLIAAALRFVPSPLNSRSPVPTSWIMSPELEKISVSTPWFTHETRKALLLRTAPSPATQCPELPFPAAPEQ